MLKNLVAPLLLLCSLPCLAQDELAMVSNPWAATADAYMPPIEVEAIDIHVLGPQLVRLRLPREANMLQLTDANGTTINSGRVEGNQLVDIPYLAPGTYHVEVRTFRGTVSTDFTIQ